MSIRSINYAFGASYGAYNQKLTNETRQKLEELGIAYNQNISENEAKKLIKQTQESKNSNNQDLSNQNFASKDELLEKAKKLAQKIGIEIPEELTFEQALSLIEAKLEEKISQSENNIDALKKLRSLSSDLASLKAQGSGSMGYDSTNRALMTSLEMLSEYNKNFIRV